MYYNNVMLQKYHHNVMLHKYHNVMLQKKIPQCHVIKNTTLSCYRNVIHNGSITAP